MRVVVSLTTRPEYHDCLKENLDSLTSQFDEVYLGLPYVSFKGIKYEDFSHKGVTVVRLNKDIGPSSKILPALIKEKRDPNTLIVTVDDDYIYSPDLRKTFEKKRKDDIKKNLTRVLTHSGTYIKYWNFGVLGLNGGWHDKNYFFDWDSDKKLTTIAGYCGCAYPSHIFGQTKDFINFVNHASTKHDKLFFNDDIILSAYLSKLKIDKIRFKAKDNYIGKFNKNTEEKLSPNPKEIFDVSHSLRNYFYNDNNFKYYSPVSMDIIFVVLIVILISYIIYS